MATRRHQFHPRCGERVVLLNKNKTAVRNFSEFNGGLVLSSEPLVDDQFFQIKIDIMINSWSGSIEMGVTTCDPTVMDLPFSATDLPAGSWILSGTSVLHDGHSLIDSYGWDLEKLKEGDRIALMRTSEAKLIFYINGVYQGVAVENLPPRVYAVVDMYGKCAQVSILDFSPLETSTEDIADPVETDADDVSTATTIGESTGDQLVTNLNIQMNVNENEKIAIQTTNPTTSEIPPAQIDPETEQQSIIQEEQIPPVNVLIDDRLEFHTRCGSLVRLSNGNRTAERRRPFDEFNNGVVMTHRPLHDDELFEIRIDRLVDKWSGSIEAGVSTHSPWSLEFPATMTNLRTGTTMMSGCGILTNGKGTKREYGEFNLDQLREGDRIGMIRRSNGNLHYYINGLDQGIAATDVLGVVWGVIDLYGMTVKVTIVDRDKHEERNLNARRRHVSESEIVEIIPEDESTDRLRFHPKCGTHAAVINNNRTAHRPNALDDFNNGVVLTNRPLKTGEVFEVQLDRAVSKWAGSIEIGVTSYRPTELEYPSTMTNVRSGTWMMTGNGVMRNGTTIIDEYGTNLDRLQVRDRVGVVRKEDSSLHFLVNGLDQGIAANDIPENVYGVVDLYGQAAQVTIVDPFDCLSPDTGNSTLSNITLYSDLRFHHIHGRNARVYNGGLTASRPRAHGEFNNAIVLSARALRDGELFHVLVEKVVDRWSGSIEAGVTTVRPEDLELPSTMTDLTVGTYMLSGSTVMKDGVTIRNGYPLDLDYVQSGQRIGLMRQADLSLHFFLDGVDYGAAFHDVPPNVYAVIDLYGQCAQVSIIPPTTNTTTPNLISLSINTAASSMQTAIAVADADTPSATENIHRLSACYGKNISLHASGTVAMRIRGFDNGITLSHQELEPGDIFEVCIHEMVEQWGGTLRIGVTLASLVETIGNGTLPSTITEIPQDTWFLIGHEIRFNDKILQSHYCPSIDWLVSGCRVGVRLGIDRSLSFLINGEDMGPAALNITQQVLAVVDLYGSVISLGVTSSSRTSPTSAALVTVASATPATTVIPNSSSLGVPANQTTITTIQCPSPPPLPLDSSPATSLIKSNDQLNSMIEMKKSPLDQMILPRGEISTIESSDGFHERHGRHVALRSNGRSAKRVLGFNHGLAFGAKFLSRNHLFQIRIDVLDKRWTHSLMIGVVASIPSTPFPMSALCLRRSAWLIAADSVFHNGLKIKSNYGSNLNLLQCCHVVGVLVDSDSRLHLFVDGVDQGVAATEIPSACWPFVDLYGQCSEVTILHSTEEVNLSLLQASLTALEINSALVNQASSNPSMSINQAGNGLTPAVSNINSITDSEGEKAELECDEKERSVTTPPPPSPPPSIYQHPNLPPKVLPPPPSAAELFLVSENSESTSHFSSQPSSPMTPSLSPPLPVPPSQLPISPCPQYSTPPPPPASGPETPNEQDNIKVRRRNINSNSRDDSLSEEFPSPAATIVTSLTKEGCSYLAACLNFKFELGLPETFFLPYTTICLCDNCYIYSNKSLTTNVLPQQQILPLLSELHAPGWCIFPLKTSPIVNLNPGGVGGASAPTLNNNSNNINSNNSLLYKWHPAFYPCRLEHVRTILDNGQLLLPEELGPDRGSLNKAMEDATDGPRLVFYQALERMEALSAPFKHEITDPKTRHRYCASVALYIFARPGSYKVSELSELVTKERGATMLAAFMVKLQSAVS